MAFGQHRRAVRVPYGTPLIVFDGDCVLCSANARFVLRHDRRGQFLLTTAQGPVGRDIYGQLGLSADDAETMILVEDGTALTESDAVIGIAGGLGWPWRGLLILRLIPRPIRDAAYRIVARNRFRWFGRRASCWQPSPEVRGRVV